MVCSLIEGYILTIKLFVRCATSIIIVNNVPAIGAMREFGELCANEYIMCYTHLYFIVFISYIVWFL